ncbi:MAG: hypothetical protein OFPI_22710 [Osedax symbiont Rs2]|nr:MAG: hypothetical protein OFPI_22710 [Osedax symbiont Rs2]
MTFGYFYSKIWPRFLDALLHWPLQYIEYLLRRSFGQLYSTMLEFSVDPKTTKANNDNPKRYAACPS